LLTIADLSVRVGAVRPERLKVHGSPITVILGIVLKSV
jgi:hypothetical protein